MQRPRLDAASRAPGRRSASRSTTPTVTSASRRWPSWTRWSCRTCVDRRVPGAERRGACRPARTSGSTRSIAAPLIARGELLGVMSLALSRLTEREERHYDADDRDFLSAIASRVAIAIDNAMLFEEERRTALAFQTSLLPQHLPTLDGLEVAWRYVPAKPLETHGQGIQTQVGGDWYDIIPLSAGRVGIVIGDVEGRGARAAAVMGQLRAALRAFAQDDKPPAEILRKLDDWCRTLARPAERTASPASSIRRWRAAPTWSTTPGPARCRSPTPGTTRRCSSPAARSASWRSSTRASCSACAARACRACPPTGRRCASSRRDPPWSSTPTASPTGGSVPTAPATTPRRRRWQMLRSRRPTRWPAADVEAIAQAAEEAVPGRHRRRHGHRRGPHLAQRPRLLGVRVPGRADQGLRGAPPGARRS